MTTMLVLLLLVLLSIGIAALVHPLIDEPLPLTFRRPQYTHQPFYAYLESIDTHPALITYTPLEIDSPVAPSHPHRVAESIRLDLYGLRRAFDGLILSRYDLTSTAAIVAEALEAEYRAIILGVWDPRSEQELDGVAHLIRAYGQEIPLAVMLGQEGLAYNRYTIADLARAAAYLQKTLGMEHRVPYCTSEPLWQYRQQALLSFGDFLVPSILFHRPTFTPEGAALWTREQALRLAQLAKKPVLVKTGYRHAGAACYTPDAQQRFWKTYTLDEPFFRLSDSPSIWIAYSAAFDAFDQPSKRQVSLLPFDGAWGLLDLERNPHPAFTVWSSSRNQNGT